MSLLGIGLTAAFALLAGASVAWLVAFNFANAFAHRTRASGLPPFELFAAAHPFGLYRWLSRFIEIASRRPDLQSQLPKARLARRLYTASIAFTVLGLLTMLLAFRAS